MILVNIITEKYMKLVNMFTEKYMKMVNRNYFRNFKMTLTELRVKFYRFLNVVFFPMKKAQEIIFHFG